MLDVPTLMFVGGFVAALCSAFLFFTWWQRHETSAALWWASGHFCVGLGVVLLAVGFASGAIPLFMVGLTFVLLAPGLIWSGVRVFEERQVRFLALAAGLAAWIGTVATLGLHGAEWALPVVNTGIAAAFNMAAAWELLRANRDKLRARMPLVALVAVNTLVLLGSIPDTLTGRMDALTPPPLASLFGLIHFETILYVIGTTLFFVAITRERSELRERQAAETDPLTGLPNRRAHLSVAERLAERRRQGGEPFAVVALDLDRFKSINDRFGHPIGDRTLQVFAEVARGALRPGDLVSRVGGEEFVAIFPGADREIGHQMAERIRRSFAEAALMVEGREVAATLSAGIAVMQHNDTLAELMERADAALYKAKLNGRDRVECGDKPARPHLHLVQVA